MRLLTDCRLLVDSMNQTIINNGHGLIEVSLYQKEDTGSSSRIFDVRMSEIGDEQSKILKELLTRNKQRPDSTLHTLQRMLRCKKQPRRSNLNYWSSPR